MKIYIKNILISIITCFTILNLMGLVLIRTEYNARLKESVVPIINGEVTNETIDSDEYLYNSFKQNYGENAPSTLLAYYQGYFMGQSSIIEIQQILIGVSIMTGAAVGIIFTWILKYRKNKKTNKSKK